jgi:hypothetical protein
MAENISRALKSAATELKYPTNKGIPISRINTYSLRSGGPNALALVGYSGTQIQRWDNGAGPRSMNASGKSRHVTPGGCHMTRSKNSIFVNIAGNTFTQINDKTLHAIEFEE